MQQGHREVVKYSIVKYSIVKKGKANMNIVNSVGVKERKVISTWQPLKGKEKNNITGLEITGLMIYQE